ncbi:MAG: MarR family transcriptional regulator [Flavobacteriales bacterium]|nr:MarR family transcriptional regulator [Flavobacteriales bacterium]
MKIEEAIKQSHFKNEYQKLVINLLHTVSILNVNQQRFFRPYDLTGQQYNILRILRGQKGNPIGVYDLVDRMLDKTSNTSRLVEKLRQKGLCDRKICENNRRQAEVTITEKGLELLKQLDPAINSFEQEMLGVSEAEARQMNALLEKVRIGFNQHEIQISK